MRPLLRSILLAKPSPAPATFCLPRRQLLQLTQLRPSPCTRCCQLQFKVHHQQQQFRVFSAEGNNNRPPNPPVSSTANPAPPNVPIQQKLKNLPSQKESRRSDVSKRFSQAMDDLQSAVFTAGQRLNDFTGYSDIESLKKSIEEQERHVKASRQAVKDAKEEYTAAINRRSASQREVNELLQRKHAWSPTDLERFTELYRSDHANEQAEAAAQERLTDTERVADEAQAQLARSILARYHEEQIWSDKIRRASTWGTWGLMGFNVFLFIIVQLGLEPWKRRRLVGGFEEKVREVIQEEGLRSALMRYHPEGENAPIEAVEKATHASILAEEVVNPTSEAVEDLGQAVLTEEGILEIDNNILPAGVGEDEESVLETAAAMERVAEGGEEEKEKGRSWLKYVALISDELFSERELSIRRVDLTKSMVVSAGLGAFVAAIISLLSR